jgi:hypothetical protein
MSVCHNCCPIHEITNTFVDAELIRRIVIQVVYLIHCTDFHGIIFIVIVIVQEIIKCFGIDFAMFSGIISDIVRISSITTATTLPTAAITVTLSSTYSNIIVG